MTYGEPAIRGGSHAPKEFYPHRPAGPPLRRRSPSGPFETRRPRTQVPGQFAVHPVVLRGRSDHFALRCLQDPARRPLGRQLAQDLAPQPAAHGRRSGPDPLSWPAAARPRRDLPLRGQERDQPLPRLRHAVRHPQRLPLHRGIDPGLPGRTPGGGLEAPSASGRPSRDSLPLAAFGPRLLQCGGDPLSPGGPPSVPDACDLPRPPARRSARTERDQRLLDLAEQRLRDLHLARCPEATGPCRDLCQMPLLSWSMASAWQATPDLRLLGTSASILRLGPGDVSPAVRHRDDLSTVASGPDSDLDTRSGAAAALRGDRPDLAECLGLVAPDGAGPASSRQSRDPLGFAAVPEDVAVVDACGGRNPGDPRLGYC